MKFNTSTVLVVVGVAYYFIVVVADTYSFALVFVIAVSAFCCC